MTTDFNMESLRLSTRATRIGPPRKQSKVRGPYRTKSGELFLKGPIPWPWLSCAAQARGKAMHVAVALWFYAGLTKSRTVALNLSRMVQMGVKRDSARRGLRALEKQKLVTVKRHAGRKPVVTILLKVKLGKRNLKKSRTANNAQRSR